MTIKEISEIEDLTGDTIRKFVATIKDYPEDVVYYERYGSEHGWYSRPYDGIVGGGIDFLFCAWGFQQNYLLFKPDLNNELDEINDCYLKGINTNCPIITIDSQAISYDSRNRVLYFDIENVKNVKVYDLKGRKLVDVTLNQGWKQLTWNLNVGVYIVNILTTNQQIHKSKIVVK